MEISVSLVEASGRNARHRPSCAKSVHVPAEGSGWLALSREGRFVLGKILKGKTMLVIELLVSKWPLQRLVSRAFISRNRNIGYG